MTLRAIPEHALDPHVVVRATGPQFCSDCGQPVGQHLTERQRAILAMIAQGMRVKEIAVALVIEPGTVKGHVAKIYRVLHARSRVTALLNASALGLIVIQRSPIALPEGV